jgi:quercetin dioxygenase-like cupin family protein
MKTVCFIIGLLVVGGSAFAQSGPTGISRKILLEQVLPPTTVEDIRIDEITCAPGQGAPAHYHPCEVYGYVVSGQIEYQVAGQASVILKAGDSFREAAGQPIQTFKNALADQPSKFVAIYLAQKGQPVIILSPGTKN